VRLGAGDASPLEEGLIENAGRVGGYLIGRLRELQKKHRHIGDVRGLGLMVGLEIVSDRTKRTPARASVTP